MLTVWAVFTGGKYPRVYLDRLLASVGRRLPATPHRFRVVTDHELAGLDTVPAETDLPGWWQKLILFRPGLAEGRNLYVDLDSVIVADLDRLAADHAGDPLAMAKNWARSGHGGWQSSVMLWQGGAFPELYTEHVAEHRGRLWGDQEWITERLGPRVREIRPGRVVSYKYHCQERLAPPPGAEIVTFHGRPDPHEVAEPWVREHWR